MGTLSTSAKRSVEQKCGTKRAEQKQWDKNWWGPLDIGCWGPSSASAKRSAEQKCGTKTAEQKLVGTLGHWVMGTSKYKCKRVSRTKMRNKNSGTIMRIKIGGDHWTLCNGDPKYKCKRVPTNFLFHIFVQLTFLHFHLGSPTPDVQ